jgi:hyperosmotically inducible periplasmic protein
MVIKKFMSCALIIGALSGCAMNTMDSKGKEVRTAEMIASDDATTAAVRGAYAAKLVKACHIHVSTYKGVVTLEGFLDSQATIDAAKAMAQSQKGVKQVISHLSIGKKIK